MGEETGEKAPNSLSSAQIMVSHYYDAVRCHELLVHIAPHLLQGVGLHGGRCASSGSLCKTQIFFCEAAPPWQGQSL